MNHNAKTPITVAYGDGIGPEIMAASLRILEAGGAQLDIEQIEIGEKVYLSGNSSGIAQSSWDSLRRTKVFYKSPITTPQGGGFKSLNVTVRKSLSLYSNVRPCVSYHPYVKTSHPGMDVVIVRENEEDLYAGVEYRTSEDSYQCLKVITRPGCEKIVRYAFDYARTNNRKKVTCMSKDNIMKMTDGLFHKVFNEIAAEYPEIQTDHMIIDIGSAKIAVDPKRFDVIVTLNLYGDIISDIAAEITGSVGLAPSANIGQFGAMFEAIHGSAPDIAGRNIANPSGLLLAGVMMLVHIGQNEAAARIQNAWAKTIEGGIHTGDIYIEGQSKEKVGTKEFADAVIVNMGQKPSTLPVADYGKGGKVVAMPELKPRAKTAKTLIGVDLYLQLADITPDDLGAKLEALNANGLKLQMISNRGVSVWPNGQKETFCTDEWRCRFLTADAKTATTQKAVIDLISAAADAGFVIATIEMLNMFGDERGFTLSQGQ